MSNETLENRMIRAELKLEEVAKSLVEEKAETRQYRQQLQDKVEGLNRLCFIGLGIVIALQFVAPVILKVLAIK